MDYDHAGIDAAAQNNMALLNAIERQHIGTIKVLLQKTDEEDHLLPGIAIMYIMRQKAVRTKNEELQKLLAS